MFETGLCWVKGLGQIVENNKVHITPKISFTFTPKLIAFWSRLESFEIYIKVIC